MSMPIFRNKNSYKVLQYLKNTTILGYLYFPLMYRVFHNIWYHYIMNNIAYIQRIIIIYIL